MTEQTQQQAEQQQSGSILDVLRSTWDTYELFADVREHMPVIHVAELDAWVLSRYEDIAPVVNDPERFGAMPADLVGEVPAEVRDSLPHGYAPWQPALVNQDPQLRERVRNDLSLVPKLVEESLRRLTPARGIVRRVKQDCEIGLLRPVDPADPAVGRQRAGRGAVPGPPEPDPGRDGPDDRRVGVLPAVDRRARRLIKEVEGPSGFLSRTQLAAGVMSAMTFLLPAMAWATAAFWPARDPEITHALVDFGWLLFITPIRPFIVQYLTLAAAIFADKRPRPAFPRWAGYMQLWISLTFLPAFGAYFLKEGPLAWNALFVWWIPFVAFTAWFGTMIHLARRAVLVDREPVPV